MEKIKKRISWIDVAKGYGIILVVLGHISVGSVMNKWIYSFHMPLFFFLSGYVFHKKDDIQTFIKKKFKSIIIPYVCLGIPMLVLCMFEHFILHDYSINDYVILIIKFIIQRRLWTLWFLTCLFFLNIIFYMTLSYFKTNRNMIIISMILPLIGFIYYKIGGVPLPYNIDVCLMAYPFFYIGYLYKEKRDISNKYFSNKGLSFVILGIINILFCYLTIKISGTGLEMFYCVYGFLPFTYLSAFAGIGCIIIVSQYTIKAIQYIGENSLVYFALHQSIMIPISTKCLSLVHFSIDASTGLIEIMLYKLLQLIIILLLCTICNIVISNTRLKFMIGK